MPAANTKGKRGGQTRYTKALGNRICKLLAGGKSLKKICAEDIDQGVGTVVGWALDKDHPFADPYARARRVRAEKLVDEMIDISDDAINDTYEDENGNIKTDNECLQRSKLRIETRKWLASKMMPSLYGEKIQVEQDIDDKRQQTRERDKAASKKFLKLQAEVMEEEKQRHAGARTTRPKPATNGKNGSNGANGRN